MKVSPEQPFKIVYSLFQHEYLGYLFESFVIQLDDKGELTFQHQNISSKNAHEFSNNLDDTDFELIRLMDSMQQDAVVHHFQRRKVNAQEFFLKAYDKDKGDELLQREIHAYMERRRAKICSMLHGKNLFEMGRDGEPAWRPIQVACQKASALFHFFRNEENTHYFPTIKLGQDKVEFYQNESFLICDEPAWMVTGNVLFTFEKSISGKKLQPFFKKKFIEIPQKVEETYYEKFVAPVIASFDVNAKGFEIKTRYSTPKAELSISEVAMAQATLFNPKEAEESLGKILFELKFKYDDLELSADKIQEVSVRMEKQNGHFIFHKIIRDTSLEKNFLTDLESLGLPLRNSRITLDKVKAFGWLHSNALALKEKGILIGQQVRGSQRYFLGQATISMEISEGIDWFDIRSVIRFGEFEIPFSTIRKHILKRNLEFKLPDGSIAVIPESWLAEYSDLFAFSNDDSENIRLSKIHISLVQELAENRSAKVDISSKLSRLLNFDQLQDYDIPTDFKGTLRAYQKAGYNWLRFLDEYGFGGCLADDMGLGKTIQALALLQSEKERNPGTTSLLIMPTSLVYNWELEAGKFTPKLKVFCYTGTQRDKDISYFSKYDVILTSYGITRLDIELLSGFYFNYILLDESQAIKNPDSGIAKAVLQLKSRRKLVVTGTPIENSTMDLWSQINFVNPGLLGGRKFFSDEYQVPIEKQKDELKTKRLNALVKPFMLRREKSQVAKDLPEKTIQIKYCDMSPEQREYYEREKSAFRNQLFDAIEQDGLQNTRMLLIQGLTRLRQIANHPAMLDETYKGGSGKLHDVTHMIRSALQENHKLLIFSQFVKHLQIVREFLEEQKIRYAYLDGSTKDRQKEVESFQEDDQINTFLISLKAGGLGLNLTRADYVFLLDPWWNPAAEAQAIDRAHRIGQTQRVIAYKFITRDTVEEKILLLQESKIQLAQDIITIEESFVKQLSKQDISRLFE
jgi:SNF2 family DNA or RNA helicase